MFSSYLITSITIIMHFYHYGCDRVIQCASLTVNTELLCKCATCRLLMYNLNSTRGLPAVFPYGHYIYLFMHIESTHTHKHTPPAVWSWGQSSTSEYCGILINEIHFFLYWPHKSLLIFWLPLQPQGAADSCTCNTHTHTHTHTWQTAISCMFTLVLQCWQLRALVGGRGRRYQQVKTERLWLFPVNSVNLSVCQSVMISAQRCAHSLNTCTRVPIFTGDLLSGDTTAPCCQTPLHATGCTAASWSATTDDPFNGHCDLTAHRRLHVWV